MMETQNKVTYRIGRRAGKQGPRPSVGNQAEVEKSATGTDSSNQAHEDHRTEEYTHRGPHVAISEVNQRSTRTKWSKEEYKDVIEAHYRALLNPKISATIDTYNIWREKHPTLRPNMDANKLANTRRDIIRKKRLTDTEMRAIKNRVSEEIGTVEQNHQKNSITENVGTCEQNENDEQNQDTRKASGQDDNEKIVAMEESILRLMEIVKETHIDKRPPLPKIRHSRKAKLALETANKALQNIKKRLEEQLSLTEINELFYATASAVAEALGLKSRTRIHKKQEQPKWKKRIEREIQMIRGELSRLSEINKESQLKGKGRKLMRRHNIRCRDDIPNVVEKLKQQLQAKSQRLRRYDKRQKFFYQNKTYEQNAKKFYRELGKKNVIIHQVPERESIERFWSSIWEEEKHHNMNAEWIRQLEKDNQDIPEQIWLDISIEETKIAIKRSKNWKSPGNDGIANFWLKHLTELHEDLTYAYNKCLESPETCPDWLTNGTTYLLPKNDETSNPKNYRPITCLPTMYKILTSILSDRAYKHMTSNNLLPVEQKGCSKGSYGCKDQLLINKAIIEMAKSRKMNLTTAWIEYKKAFDSVPHSWILKCIEMFKISPIIGEFMKSSMKKWITTLCLNHEKGTLTSRKININNGIFQGDTLSPLLFCVALAPLSALINKSGYGFKTNSMVISHLFYMDDLKTFAKNDEEQQRILAIVKAFSDDVKMEFGLEKCAKATFKKGKLTSTENINLGLDTVIQDLGQDSTYKYLGINEGDGIQHATMKEKIRKEYYRRIRLVLGSELNAVNRTNAINTLAVPVVTYSFNIINWTVEDLKKLDRKTRKLLTMGKMHHPKADKDRLYLPRKSGGRGLIQIKRAYKTTTIGLNAYINNTGDKLLGIVRDHDKIRNTKSLHYEAKKFEKEFDMPTTTIMLNETVIEYARRIKRKTKDLALEQLQNVWKEKPLHGQYPKRLHDNDVNEIETNKWLSTSGLKSETEGFIIAAQDQCLKTNYYRHKILKDGTNPMCRICSKQQETIDHLVSGCSELAKTEYTQRHNRIAAYIHWKICKHYNIKVTDKYYEHEPKTVTENNEATILWDMPIQTDREIKANRPDIVVKDKKQRTCQLI